MSDFKKIEHYHDMFDEKNRLNVPDGKLEFEITWSILVKYLPENAEILDLGCGAGIYSIALAKRGYKMTLANLSPKLIKEAKSEIYQKRIENIINIDVVNAVDLSIYDDNSFDVVLLLGPLYHLTEMNEREKCIKEVNRELRTGGLVFASFVPYLSGGIGIVDRLFRDSEQVDVNNLAETFHSGVSKKDIIRDRKKLNPYLKSLTLKNWL